MRNIVAAIDYSDAALPVINTAANIARAFDANLWIIHAEDSERCNPCGTGLSPSAHIEPTHSSKWYEEHSEKKYSPIRQRVTELKEGGVRIQVKFNEGIIEDVILEEIDRTNADLLVTGSHSHGAFYNLLVTGVNDVLTKNLKCPLMMVPASIEALVGR